MKSRKIKVFELLLLFVLFPVSLVFNYSIWIKVLLGSLGFVYILWVLFYVEKSPLVLPQKLPWKPFILRTSVLFGILVIGTVVFVMLNDSTQLFFVPANHPRLFFTFVMVYFFLSAWPQEILYRNFFFTRYENLFSSTSVLILMNAILFSAAHLFFRNTLVLVITFIGGILFGLTYRRFKSTTLVTLEHALYGNWLFAVGMGGMLGFPT